LPKVWWLPFLEHGVVAFDLMKCTA